MTRAITASVALALLVFLGSHASILASLVARRPRYRAAVALVVPPLTPYWGWREGFRRRVYAWATALLLYAVGVFALAR